MWVDKIPSHYPHFYPLITGVSQNLISISLIEAQVSDAPVIN
jgi:hypothetical protein